MADQSSIQPTFVASQPLADDPGLVMTTSGQAWLYRVVPPAPCTDAATPADRDRAGEPLMGALRELEQMAPARMGRRSLSKAGYREIHLLTSKLPGLFKANPARVDAAALNAEMGTISVARHQALIGVRLNASAKRDTWRQAIADVADMLSTGGASLDDFVRDRERINTAMRRQGLGVPTVEQMRCALAWWNEGVTPSTILLPDGDHLHVFATVGAARTAQRSIERGVECTTWAKAVTGHRVMTLASVVGVSGGWEVASTEALSLWMSRLHRGGAIAVSVRALVEPATVTRGEMRRHRREYEHDIREAQASGKMDRAESEERLAELTETERAYSRGGPPTLTSCRVTVAMDGQWADPTTMGNGLGVNLEALVARQAGAWSEMQIGSTVRENPWQHDWPAQRLSHSGAADISQVGDGDMAAVLWGFTEHDRQPAFFEPRRATDEDGSGFSLVAGATGSGKALTLTTRIVTPDGYTTMEQVRVGDTVYAIDGQPTAVTWVSEVNRAPDLYRVRAETGQSFDCDFDHQWPVIDLDEPEVSRREARKRARRALGVAKALASHPAWPGQEVDAEHLLQVCDSYGGGDFIRSTAEIKAALAMVDVAPGSSWGMWDEREALRGLARRLTERYTGAARLDWRYQRLTVGEMLARGGTWAVPLLQAPIVGSALPSGDGGAVEAAIRACEGQPIARRYLRGRAHARQVMIQAAARHCGWSAGERYMHLVSASRRTADQLAYLARSLGWLVYEPEPVGDEWIVDVDTQATILRIESIEPIPSAPARCITVAHPTRTYLVEGCVPTSNTMLLLNHARQLHRQGRDVVSFGPKPMANAAPVLQAYGGRLIDLSDLISADGILDAFGYAASLEMAVNMSASNILSANPWGTAQARGRYEVDLLNALRAGAQAGARTSGAALQLAHEAGAVPEEVYQPVMKLASTSPQFRAFVGLSNQTSALRDMRGWTHIQVGKMGLDLPSERDAAAENLTVSQRVSVTLVRSLITSLTYALQERGGSILQDEAWVSMLAGPSELDRAGRLCREFGVDIVLFNQKVSEAYAAGLAGYFRRGMVLALDDASEARAALGLFNSELVTPERVERICAQAYKGTATSRVPNWASMRHLSDPDTGAVLRGSVGFMLDLERNCVPVEVVLPPSFLQVATTNAAVLRERRAATRKG
ncbi:MAG: hypothetical protein E6640_01905 [Actinomyces urogenitalis]|uniref:hypothetical protein n=1 Tax=Actinomyces urogenitalis TaxID=103621 RepID=UPI00291089F1|nr:hypothetical protein [Actinomyces urogenitalis]MDU6150966.1 hypothetical protein [Actinomyces urogenitalis]